MSLTIVPTRQTRELDRDMIRTGQATTGCRMSADLTGALKVMFDVAPRDWWQYVPCGVCNARRQQLCRAHDGRRVRPHVARVRAGLLLHGTLWLLREHPQDVVGEAD